MTNSSLEKAKDFCKWWRVGKDTTDLTCLKRRQLAIEEIRQLLDQERIEALEEAARVADAHAIAEMEARAAYTVSKIEETAKAIRSLKDKGK